MHILNTLKRDTVQYTMGSDSSAPTQPHALLFPFMSKGHIIPLLQLARLLLNRHLSVTVITTPGNRPFVSSSLSDTTTNIIEIPFPQSAPGIPPGVENTEKLPSMSLIAPFGNATKLMQPHFEQVLENLMPPVTFLVSDGFLGWTLSSASKFGIPRLATFGTNKYSMVVFRDVAVYELFSNTKSDGDEPVALPSFPWIKVSKNEFDSNLTHPDLEDANTEFRTNIVTATSNSYGVLVNSFYELEPVFVDYWNREVGPRASCIGPLCLAEPWKTGLKPTNKWLQWLDQNLTKGKPVLYVAFGSQADMSNEQFKEIATGLEKSNINFLWAVGGRSYEFEDGYEERVKERGVLLREWVDQKAILGHEGVTGFLSHCGWNSCLESICACVPILAFPLGAEQFLNTRMLVEELKIGLRVQTCDGSVRGFVKSDALEKMVIGLMEGEMGEVVRTKVKEVGQAAKAAMEEGGSSYRTLDNLITELCNFTQ